MLVQDFVASSSIPFKGNSGVPFKKYADVKPDGKRVSKYMGMEWIYTVRDAENGENAILISIDNTRLQGEQSKTWGKVYSETTLSQLEFFYANHHPHDRHVYENVVDVHKPMMDLDRSLSTVETSEPIALERMSDLFRRVFLPYFKEFLSEKIGQPVLDSHVFVSDASREGRKFSKHVTIHTEEVHCFKDRVQEWAFMVLFHQYLIEKCEKGDEELKEFLHFHENGAPKTTMDMTIYKAGRRDMRLVGSCKGDGACKSVDRTRVLVPETLDVPYTHYMVLPIPGEKITMITLSESAVKKACTYDRSLAGAVARKMGMGRKVIRAFQKPLQDDEFYEKRVDNAEDVDFETNETEVAFLEYYNRVCSDIAQVFVGQITGGLEPCPYRHKSYMVNFDYRLTNSDGKRVCFFGEEHSRHYAGLLVDIYGTVQYMCYGCKFKRKTILQSIVSRTPSARSEFVLPLDVAEITDRYDEEWMRPINFRLDDHETIMLKGNMGTGKTEAMDNYLKTVDEEASILCIGFRRVLNSSLARRFGLVDYQEIQGSLYNQRRLVIQIDSLKRLLMTNTRRERFFRESYDVVIVDEVESLLAHVCSGTLSKKLLVVWNLFELIVKRCKKLLLSDADLGERTFEFVRMVRGLETARLSYNTRVKIEVSYYALPTKRVFLSKLESLFIHERKRVYLCTNGKHEANAIRRHLERKIRELTEAATTFAEAIDVQNLEQKILLIDSDTSESVKRRTRDANAEWVNYSLVICTPTVAAGIDFSIPDHFHCTMVFGINFSNTARELNQQNGRIRRTIENTTYTYFDPPADKNRNLPLTLEEVEAEMRKRGENTGSDIQNIVVPGITQIYRGETVLAVRTGVCPEILERIMSFNELEKNRSAANLQEEFYRVVLECDGHAMIHCGFDYNLYEDSEAGIEMTELMICYNQDQAESVASQPIISEQEYKDLQKAINTATDHHAIVKDRVRKYEIMRFYGLNDLRARDVLHIGSQEKMDQVITFSYLGCGMKDMYLSDCGSDENPGILTPFIYRKNDGTETIINARTVVQKYKPAYLVKLHTMILAYASGFDLPDEDPTKGTHPEILIQALYREGHAVVAKERLESPTLQDWLKANWRSIKEERNVKNSCDGPRNGGDWEWVHISAFFASYMEQVYGIRYRSIGKHWHPNEWGYPPSCSRIRCSRQDYHLMLELSYAHFLTLVPTRETTDEYGNTREVEMGVIDSMVDEETGMFTHSVDMYRQIMKSVIEICPKFRYVAPIGQHTYGILGGADPQEDTDDEKEITSSKRKRLQSRKKRFKVLMHDDNASIEMREALMDTFDSFLNDHIPDRTDESIARRLLEDSNKEAVKDRLKELETSVRAAF